MNHILRFESYSIGERLDDILDKISKYGIDHLTKLENEFLNSFKSGNEVETHDKIKYMENEVIFEDTNGDFKFELKSSKKHKKSKHYYGTIYVPPIEINGKMIEGCLDGKIIEYRNGSKSLDFSSQDGRDIFEFCSGIEYELDNFIDYVISEISI